MSFETCLICSDPITNISFSVTVNQFTDRSKQHHIHKWCFSCMKCHVPLTMSCAVVSDDMKELLCLTDHIGNILPDCNFCGRNCASENVRESGFFYHKDCHARMMQPPLTPESEGDCQDDLVAQEETVIFLDPNENFGDLQNFITSNSPELDSTDITQYFQTFQPESKLFQQQFKAKSVFEEFLPSQNEELKVTPLESSQPMVAETAEQNNIVYQLFQPQQQNYYPYQQHESPFPQQFQYQYQQEQQFFSMIQNQQTGVFEFAAVNGPAHYHPTQYIPVEEENLLVNVTPQRIQELTSQTHIATTYTRKSRRASSTESASSYGSKPGRQGRATITKEQKSVLDKTFADEKFPSRQTRIDLGSRLGLHPRQVQIWFQNARSKLKKTDGTTKSRKITARAEY